MSSALAAAAELETRATTPDKLSAWSGVPLRRAAQQCLLESDALRKAELSFQIARAWQEGLLPLDDDDASAAESSPPDTPGRPSTVRMVQPTKLKATTKKALIHALVHAESYAIDLGWDMVARFGFSPSLWPVAPENREAALAAGLAAASEASTKEADELPAGAEEDACSSSSRAPRSFFDDWVRLSVEEARHFSRWRLRLAELGVQYGDLPAHAGLWESASETAHSLAARLAIVHCVHEARGLDVAPLMRTKLAGGGDDAASPAILDANVRDEITHVGTGAKWLRWVARREGLEAAPLYHALVRAYFRGLLRPPFNDDFRQRAGMPADWYLPLASAPPQKKEASAAAAGGKEAAEGEGEEEISHEDMG